MHNGELTVAQRKRVFPSLAACWTYLKPKPKERSNCTVSTVQLSPPDPLNTDLSPVCNHVKSEAENMDRYPDDFTKVLDQEGLLKYSNPVNKCPVLTLCHGFMDSELSVLSCQNEKQYKESFSHLDKDKQESYTRLFSSHYPLEPLVDGLPGSVWLECVEPTLAILKALNTLKRRKSNLSIRKCYMPIIDSNAACHGDFETAPLMMNPFVNGHLRLLRVHFLALEGVIGAQPRHNQNSLHEVQEDRQAVAAPTRRHEVQRRRHLRMYRPYEILHSLIRNADHLENIFEFGEMIRNQDNYQNGRQDLREM